MASQDDTGIPFDTCAHCGVALERDVRYPAATREGDDGKPDLFSFCDRECERAWNETNEGMLR